MVKYVQGGIPLTSGLEGEEVEAESDFEEDSLEAGDEWLEAGRKQRGQICPVLMTGSFLAYVIFPILPSTEEKSRSIQLEVPFLLPLHG